MDKNYRMATVMDKLKYTARLAGVAAFTLMKIMLAGIMFSAVAGTTALIIILAQLQGAGHGLAHAGAAAMALLFAIRPFGMIIFCVIAFVSPWLFLVLGNKYILRKIIYRIIKDKGESLLEPLLDTILGKLKKNQPELLKQGTDMARLRLQALQEIKSSSENKWLRRAAAWGLSKAQLDHLEAGNETLDFTDIIKQRTIAALHDSMAPSRKFFWVIVGVEWLLVALIYFKIA
jgi:hypothetical protein